MSQMVATVKSIVNYEQINIVEFELQGFTLKMMSLDLNEKVQVGKRVQVGVKPSNIALAKDLTGELSFSNQLKATIENIDNGELLSSITLKIGESILESIITKSSSKRMKLEKNENIIVLIKASDVSIMEVLND
ncbi:MAG: TOBE domain-containing protein [Arcobacteraceae bacterium]